MIADRKELANAVISSSLSAGATAVEVSIQEGLDFSTTIRHDRLEKLQQACFRKLGVRIFAGNRTAISATSDFSDGVLEGVVRDTLELARAAGDDPATGLPPSERYSCNAPIPETCFPSAASLPAADKIELARRCERASFACNERIRNSEGSGFSDSLIHMTYANSLGICSSYSRTKAKLWTAPLAEADGQKQRDSWHTTHPDFKRLQAPEEVGREAARRALRRLGARRVATCEVPVVFDPVAAAAVLRHLSEAVSGTALLRKASFLMDKLGKQVASRPVTILDDALLPFGLATRPFDAEGIPSQSTTVIRDGVLESFLLDTYSGRKLRLHSTANSNRELHGTHSSGPSNFYLVPGNVAPEEIISSVKGGLYVTELIGFGVNIVSGDFSQGAAGLWIENGRLAFPVEEITVAGNLKDMLTGIEAVGNDLLVLAEIFAPTFMIGRMVVSGK